MNSSPACSAAISPLFHPVMLLLLIGGLIGVCRTAAAQDQLSPQAVRQMNALMQEKASRTLVQQKIESKLLIEAKRRSRHHLPVDFPALRSSVKLDAAARVEVDIEGTISPRVLEAIEVLGGSIVNSHAKFHAIRARMPLDQIERFAAEPDVRFISPAIGFLVNKVNTSAGDVAHGADVARTMFGVDGTGVQIGVVSNGVATLAARQASGDLPPTVTILPGQAGSGDEGTAMLEIVFDLAPGADLFFATGTGSEAQMAQNILDLQAAGCDVIVDDMFYLGEDTFQDDVIAQAVETVVVAGASYFSSAGNSGNKNDGTSGVWEGDFVPVAAPAVIGGSTQDFGGGANSNVITLDSPSWFVLQWADPHLASENDYDLYLLNATLTTILDVSTNVQSGTQSPFESIDSGDDNDLGNRLLIVPKAGASTRYLHLNANRGQLSINTAGQTAGHAAAASAFAVAAVNVEAAGGAGGVFDGTETVEAFSSDGPRRVFFLANGTAITPGNFSSTGGTLRNKPDFTAADGVATATPGFNPFLGTSAAAPHAAAIAALMIEQGPYTTPAAIRMQLASTSLDIEGAGWDRDSGFGILDAAAAVVSGPPSPRYGHTAIHDPVRNRMIVFGGWDGAALNDLWALPMVGSPVWASLASSVTPPSSRFQHAAIYDRVRDRMVMFGGSGGGFLDDIDVWALSLSPVPSWAHLAFTGAVPTERNWAAATYDPVRDRMVMFGGSDNAGYYNDVWAMSLSGSPTWTMIIPTGTAPAARYAPTAIYDPVRDRLVGFGGYAMGVYLSDVWSLSLSGTPAWTASTPMGTPPSPRFGPAAIYDPARDRMVMFGGRSNGNDLNDMWALSLSGTPAWSNITPSGAAPGPRLKPAAVYDVLRDRMVLFGGIQGSVLLNDTWAISLAGTPTWTNLSTPALVAVVETPPVASGLSIVLAPNGAGHELRYSLPMRAKTKLCIFDLSGRIVATLVDGDATAGIHRVVWGHVDRSGREVSSGVYFVLLQSGSRNAQDKIVVLK